MPTLNKDGAPPPRPNFAKPPHPKIPKNPQIGGLLPLPPGGPTKCPRAGGWGPVPALGVGMTSKMVIRRRLRSSVRKNSSLLALGVLLAASLLIRCLGDSQTSDSAGDPDAAACTSATLTHDCELPPST